MTGESKAGIAIGGLSGGLLGYIIVRRNPVWAMAKKVLAVAAGVLGGGAIGYGLSRVSGKGRRSHQMAALRPYGKYESSASLIYEDGTALAKTPTTQRKPTCRNKNSCLRPSDELRGNMLQWVELVKSPRMHGEKTELTSSADVYRYFRDAALAPQENFYMLMVNNRNNPIGHILVARGTNNQAMVDPSDVFRPALLAGAVRIIVAHNHPSGDAAPSPQDVALTRRLSEAGDKLGVKVLDHIVISDKGYASLRDMGLAQ